MAFNQQVVNSLVPMFDKHFQGMVESLNSMIGKGVFNIQPYSNEALFKSICHALLEEVVSEGFSEAEMEE